MGIVFSWVKNTKQVLYIDENCFVFSVKKKTIFLWLGSFVSLVCNH